MRASRTTGAGQPPPTTMQERKPAERTRGQRSTKENGEAFASPFRVLERETRLELATSTLARLRSTN